MSDDLFNFISYPIPFTNEFEPFTVTKIIAKYQHRIYWRWWQVSALKTISAFSSVHKMIPAWGFLSFISNENWNECLANAVRQTYYDITKLVRGIALSYSLFCFIPFSLSNLLPFLFPTSLLLFTRSTTTFHHLYVSLGWRELSTYLCKLFLHTQRQRHQVTVVYRSCLIQYPSMIHRAYMSNNLRWWNERKRSTVWVRFWKMDGLSSSLFLTTYHRTNSIFASSSAVQI